MAKDKKESEESNEPKKSKLGLIIGIVAGIVVLVGGVVAGILFGPRLMGGGAQEAQAQGTEAAPVEKAPDKIVSAKFEPIVIDIRSRRGTVHHLKVGLSVELAEGVAEPDFLLVRPRGREAALAFLRTLNFSDATDPTKYEEIKTELAKRVMDAIGEDKLHRVLLVDWVAQ